MQLINPDDIPIFIKIGEYKKQCSLYLCIPLYWCNCEFDLKFLHSSILKEYAQTLFCGFKK
jgi:hypothetical protein